MRLRLLRRVRHFMTTDFIAPIAVALVVGFLSSWLGLVVGKAVNEQRFEGLEKMLDNVRGIASAAHRRIDDLLTRNLTGD